ncbi:MAG: hypothetical protein L6420_07705 [Elusimicrobia bacterium]|nr:hypothetical protein [Elusimicrobiota bacterium]
MKKRAIPIVAMIFFVGLIIYSARIPQTGIVTDWRDAPDDISFEMAGSLLDADAIRSYQNENIPLPQSPVPIESGKNLLYHSDMSDACSQKFGGDTSFLKNSFLRIPTMTRNLFISRERECQFNYDGAISDMNCGRIVRCVNGIVNREKRMLGKFNANGEDDANKFYGDIRDAVRAYESLSGEGVSYDDIQDGSLKANWERFLNSGTANFNPNAEETQVLFDSVKNAFQYGQITQGELVHEAILAANGNIVMGIGSLAKIFHDNRDMNRDIQGMENAAGKNYYRFVGMYIGLHDSMVIRQMGSVAGYANIMGNPVVYGTDKVCKDFWKATKFALDYYGLKSDADAEPVDFEKTLDVFGPNERGNLIDKIPEYTKGISAAVMYRKNNVLE